MSDALDRLLEVEAEATEGPWDIDPVDGSRAYLIGPEDHDPVAGTAHNMMDRESQRSERNARFIAVSRNVFRALVEEVRAGRRFTDALPGDLELDLGAGMVFLGHKDKRKATDAAIERALGGGDE